MIRKITSACLVAILLGGAGTVRGVAVLTDWDKRGLPPGTSGERSLTHYVAAAGPGESDASLHVMTLKPAPQPRAPIAPRPQPKPQPTPRPTPQPPGVKPTPAPSPTPPVTRPS